MKMRRADILAHLVELDNALSDHGACLLVDVKAAGGAALAFYWADRATDDIDVAYPKDLPADMLEAARRIAAKRKLSSTWINTSVAYLEKPPERMFSKNVYNGKRFRIYVPDKETLFAMKIRAGREKDLRDTVRLAKDIGATDSESIAMLLRRCYTERVAGLVEQENKGFIAIVLARLQPGGHK